MKDATLPAPCDRNLFFCEQVEQKSIKDLAQKIIEINDDDARLIKIYDIDGIIYKPKPIKIFIDSYGGSVYQCYGLLSVMENSKVPIHTIVTGCAMSCGFMILISGHRRFAHKLSTPLYHQASGGVYGTVKETEDHLLEMRRLQQKIEEITLSKTKITKTKLKDIYEKKIDWYMSASEALKLGVVDEII